MWLSLVLSAALAWAPLNGSPQGFPAQFPDRFPLFPTMGSDGASGMVDLTQPWSPFGVSVDRDGRVQYEVRVVVSGLAESADAEYRVWLTTPELDRTADLGPIKPGREVVGTTVWNQLMVVVSREPADSGSGGDRWSGPIVLRGFSAGARVTPMAQHSLFQQSPM
jgi:hypothetical protein